MRKWVSAFHHTFTSLLHSDDDCFAPSPSGRVSQFVMLKSTARQGLLDLGYSASEANAIIRDNGLDPESYAGAQRWAQGASADEAMAMAEAQMGMMTDYGLAMIAANEEATERAIQRNIERFPELTRLSREETERTGSFINEFMSNEFYASMDDLYPEWREDIIAAGGEAQADSIAMTRAFKERVLPQLMSATDEISAQSLGIVNAQLRGEIPDDVAAQLRRQAAEVSQQLGIRGQAAQYLTARDLGRTSYDIMQQGLANAPAALALAPDSYNRLNQTLQAPVTTGINLTNLLSAYRAPQADVQALYGSNLGIVSGAGLIPAGTAMTVNAQTLQGAGQLAQSAIQGSLEYTSQQYWNQRNSQLQQQALHEQKRANTLNFISSVAGAAGQVGAAGLMLL